MAKREPRSLVRKWGKRVAKWAAVLGGTAIVAVFVLLHNLDQPWVKRQVQAIVAKQTGFAIDYGSARFAWSSGIDVDELVVFSPPEMRGVAPDLARIGHVAARWSPRSLVADTRIAHLALTDVAVTIAVDENGRTSLDTHFPPVPLSQRAASLFGSPLQVDAVEVERLAVTVVDADHGAVVERTTVRGLALKLDEERAERSRGARLRLGAESAPLELDLERHGSQGGEGTARARAFGVAVASSSDLALTIDLRVVDQSLVPSLGVGRALHAAGRAHFDAPLGRTEVTLNGAVTDGSVRASDTFVTIPDEGPSVLHYAVGDLDAVGLLAGFPAERATVRYRIAEATLAMPPRLDEGGAIAIDGDVAKLRLALDGGRSLRVDTGALAFHVLPDGDGHAVHGSAALDGVATASSAGETRMGGAEIRIDGRERPDGALDGTLDLRFASVHTSGSAAVEARGGHAALQFGELYVDRAKPSATRGDLALAGEVASVSARTAWSSGLASALGVHAHVRLAGHAPQAANAEVTAARLVLSGRAKEKLADAPARIAIDVTNANLDFARPIASTGAARVEVALGDAKATIDAGKEADAVSYELHAHAPSLEPARPFLPESTLVPLQRMALALESKGRVERLSSALPELHHHTKLDIEQPGFGSVSARSLAVTVDSRGTVMRHDAEIDLRARELDIPGIGAADEHVTISAKIDRAQPALHLVVGTDGRTTGKLAVTASFDRARHALAYDVDGSASKLAPLAPLLADVPGLRRVDLSALEVDVSAKGELLGVIAGVDADGTVRLEPNPSVTAALNGPVDVRVEHFALARGDLALAVPKLDLHTDFGLAGDRRTFESRLDIGSAFLVSGAHEIEVGHVSDRLSATVVGDLRNPDAQVVNHASLEAFRQEFVPAYPIADVSVDLSARRDHRGIVRLDDLRLASVTGGTKISVTGDLDVSGDERKLALEGEIEQDVARLSGQGGDLGGRGRASAKVRIESADLVAFRTRSDVRLAGVDLRLPRAGIVIESVEGEIPIQLEFRAVGGRMTLVPGRRSSPFALLRFVDQHPLLSRTSFLRARSITTPYTSIAPFVGNLQVDRTILSLAQVEMGVRGGRVTGACTFDYAGEDSTLEVHLRASGLRASNDDQLDAIAAFVVSQRDSSVEGRGEILRIGKQQFIELLDIVDPSGTNASVNRIRSALSYGHPTRVNLAFKHGFANAHVEMGGLASLVTVGDIRGIPTGPVFERILRARHRSKGRR